MNESQVKPTAPAASDVTGAIAQLRQLVCLLGAGLLILSVAFSLFVEKQNRNLRGVITAQRAQVTQLENVRRRIAPVMTELGEYSLSKPELAAIFQHHGIQVVRQQTNAAPAKPKK